MGLGPPGPAEPERYRRSGLPGLSPWADALASPGPSLVKQLGSIGGIGAELGSVGLVFHGRDTALVLEAWGWGQRAWWQNPRRPMPFSIRSGGGGGQSLTAHLRLRCRCP